jgi:iron complex transport system substrate-binding protein
MIMVKLVSSFLYIFFFFSLLACLNSDKTPETKNLKIISLSPHITEIIYALGAENELHAVSDYCKFPADAIIKEKVGGLINPNIEKIVSIKPTLILGVPSHEKLNTELQKFGLNIIMLPNENISDVMSTIDSVGTLTGKQDVAKKLTADLRDSLSAIAKDNGSNGCQALLVIGRERGTIKNITAAGDDTFISEVWQLAGGINVFSDLPTRYGSVNLETILTRNPQVIVEFDMECEPEIDTMKDPAWKQMQNVMAVEKGQIFTVCGNHTLIPGPRLIILARQFKKIINSVKNASGSHQI